MTGGVQIQPGPPLKGHPTCFNTDAAFACMFYLLAAFCRTFVYKTQSGAPGSVFQTVDRGTMLCDASCLFLTG